MARKSKRNKRTESQPESADDFEDEILSRFLVDKKDNILGESIGIEGKDLIIKHKNKFYLIPRSAVKLVGKKLVLKRKVDWIAALAKGKGWKKEELDPLWGDKTPKKKPPSKKKGSASSKGAKKPSPKKKPPSKKGKKPSSKKTGNTSSKNGSRKKEK